MSGYSLEDFDALPPVEESSEREIKRLPSAEPIEVDSFDLSPRIMGLIRDGSTNGYPSRSERDAAVVTALVNAGATDGQIRGVFESFPGGVGDKYGEKGNGARYLERTIAFARGGRSTPSEGVQAPSAAVPVTDTVELFRRWLWLPDPRGLLAAVGTVAANHLDGDPVWLLLVGPPGGGKSEVVQSLAGLPKTHPAATLTEASLLSGTPKRERTSESKGGLLRAVGEFGILLVKDFGSILSMHRDARSSVLAALREIYDGSWTRHLGTDGGKTLTWEGKVGLVGGVTPHIDRHHAVMSSLGERFLLFRLHEEEVEQQTRQALAHAGQEKQMRAELREAVAGLVGAGFTAAPPLSEVEREKLISLAAFAVRARSAVERDGYSREIELIPDAEAPTRLAVVLDRLLAGLSAVGVDRELAWSVIEKAALDCIPALRRQVLGVLHGADEVMKTSAVAALTDYPRPTTHRALEDLTAHRLVVRFPAKKKGDSDKWELTDWARGHHHEDRGVPEMSGGRS